MKKSSPKSAQKTPKVKKEQTVQENRELIAIKGKSPEVKKTILAPAVKSEEATKEKSPGSKKSIQKPEVNLNDTTAAKRGSDTDVALPWVDKYKPTSLKQIIGNRILSPACLFKTVIIAG